MKIKIITIFLLITILSGCGNDKDIYIMSENDNYFISKPSPELWKGKDLPDLMDLVNGIYSTPDTDVCISALVYMDYYPQTFEEFLEVTEIFSEARSLVTLDAKKCGYNIDKENIDEMNEKLNSEYVHKISQFINELNKFGRYREPRPYNDFKKKLTDRKLELVDTVIEKNTKIHNELVEELSELELFEILSENPKAKPYIVYGLLLYLKNQGATFDDEFVYLPSSKWSWLEIDTVDGIPQVVDFEYNEKVINKLQSVSKNLKGHNGDFTSEAKYILPTLYSMSFNYRELGRSLAKGYDSDVERKNLIDRIKSNYESWKNR